MKHYLLLLVFALCFVSANAQPTESQLAADKAALAQYHLDLNHLDSAILLFDIAFRIDPSTIHYQYQKAFCYYLKKEYKLTTKIVRALLLHEDADDAYFQLLGSAYRELGNSAKALEAFRIGLLKYPNSGKLYMNMGIVAADEGNDEKAIIYWEKGIELTPDYSSNYYWAAKHFSGTDEKIWVLIYGELFINLERNTVRSYEMSELLFKTYKEVLAITDTGDYDLADLIPGIATDQALDPDSEIKASFGSDVEKVMNISSVSLVGSLDEELYILDLNTLRNNFIRIWISEGYDKVHKNIWTNWMKSIFETGGFDAYNYWLFNQGSFTEFEQWYAINEEYYATFIAWFRNVELQIRKSNYFVRHQN